MASTALVEHPGQSIAVPVGDPTATTNPRRGGDVRVFDRRDMREVGGPGHPFVATTDLLVTNGLIRYWVGPRGMVPYLNVAAWSGGLWRHVGCLALCAPGSLSTLTGARLVSATPEHVTVALSVRNKGTITIRLQRGHRRLTITHGSRRLPTAFANRYVGWTGTPPATTLVNASVSPASFGNGLVVGANGAAVFTTPPLMAAPWTVSLWWKPTAASSTLPDAGLLSLLGPTGTVLGTLQWIASTKVLRWTNGATVLNSSAVTFASGQSVNIQLRQGITGRTLTVKPSSGTVSHATDTATIGPLGSLSLGQVGATATSSVYGSGQYGTGTYGQGSVSGGVGAGGPIDNVGLFSDALTDTEAATLAAANVALGGLPSPESRLVWYAPFDVAPFTPGGSNTSLVNGFIYETTLDNGSTQAFYQGLSRNLFTFKAADKQSGLALRRSDISWTVVAAVTTSAAGDTTNDALGYSASSSDQETTVR